MQLGKRKIVSCNAIGDRYGKHGELSIVVSDVGGDWSESMLGMQRQR